MITPKGDFFWICYEENKTIIAVEEIGVPASEELVYQNYMHLPDSQVQID